jgi:hypothetical protein
MLKYIRSSRAPYWQGPEGERYDLVMGGLSWPIGDKPGYLVVIAREAAYDYALRQHKVKILAVREGASLNDLYRGYQELAAEYSPDGWLGDTANNENIRYMTDLADQRRERFFLHWCPQSSLTVYLSLIEELSRAARKILYFGNFDIIGKYIMSMPADERTRPVKEHPLLAALGYALYEVHATAIVDDEDEETPDVGLGGRSAVTGY